MNKPNQEALLEVGRLVLLTAYAAVLPLIIALIALPMEQLLEALKSPLTYFVIAQAAILAVLRAFDKRRHVQGKIENDPGKKRGITF